MRTTWGVGVNVLNVEDATITFFENVFEEVLDLFPSPFICVGGDECRKDQWRESPSAQARMSELGLRRRGTRSRAGSSTGSTSSSPLVAGGSSGGTRSWRAGWPPAPSWPPGAATWAPWRRARAGHDVITCPSTSVYLDYRQAPGEEEPVPFGTVLGLEDVYAFEPLPKELRDDPAARTSSGRSAPCGPS
ncbi:hypothetical protein GCM10020219_083670 [Nonomuraea dietziae]